MKKILLIMTLIFSLSSFATCDSFYYKSAKRRNAATQGLAVAGAFAIGSVAFFVPGAAVLSLTQVGYTLGLTTAWPLARYSSNHYYKVMGSYKAAKNGTTTKYLAKLIKKSQKRSGSSTGAMNGEELLSKFVKAYENKELCPLKRVTRKGREIREVFNKRELISFLSN